ncbi:flavin reductase family protein [Sphaerisporangium aureirubrum]|uniref:Flavin reductase family protein n=1 Tax=Sphaerisporangium aureirubrum TaxID=1544736 RepID=A0ABW1NQJ0_9ACTN
MPRQIDSIAAGRFRNLMSTFPSGVAVVTTVGRHGTPYGMTVSSLCSLSLKPALLLVSLRRGSETLAEVVWRGVFAVNLLHLGGREAAIVFSSPAPARFAAVGWDTTPIWSLPALPEHAHTTMECAVDNVVAAGDHTLVIGKVAGATGWREDAVPLLYGLRRYEAWPDEPAFHGLATAERAE